MNDDHIARLTTLRSELAALEPPDYPDAFWPLIDRWISKTTPTIRHDWNEFLEDFQKIAIKPGNSSGVSKRDRRSRWEAEKEESEKVRQNLLEFLSGLLDLQNPRLKSKPSGDGRLAQYSNVITALLGLFGTVILAYFGYRSARVPVDAPIGATQTAQAQLTAIAFTFTSTPLPTFSPTPLPPFDVAVTIQGGATRVEGGSLIEYPSPTGMTLEVQLTESTIDHCTWNVEWELSLPPPDPQGCLLSFPALPTFGQTIVNIGVITTDGKSLQRTLTLKPRQ